MTTGWIDSHAHIMGDEFVEEFETIKENALAKDVKKICIICGSLLEIERALSLVEEDEMFDLAVGVHPSNAKDITKAEFEAMMAYLDHPKVAFLGEIGLDFYWDQSFNDLQEALFIEQINRANQHHLPIIIHMRDSTDAVYEVIKKYPVINKGVAHCFTESLSSAQRFVDLGFYIGVGGIVTFKNGENIRELVLGLPFDKILTETDSPYLAPVPKRGKRNEPAYVAYVGQAIATLKDMDEGDVQSQLKQNYEKLKGTK